MKTGVNGSTARPAVLEVMHPRKLWWYGPLTEPKRMSVQVASHLRHTWVAFVARCLMMRAAGHWAENPREAGMAGCRGRLSLSLRISTLWLVHVSGESGIKIHGIRIILRADGPLVSAAGLVRVNVQSGIKIHEIKMMLLASGSRS